MAERRERKEGREEKGKDGFSLEVRGEYDPDLATISWGKEAHCRLPCLTLVPGYFVQLQYVAVKISKMDTTRSV